MAQTVYIGLGSNLGDRQSNILHALQRLRPHATIERVSSYFEIPALDGIAGPPFLNVAARLSTELERGAFGRVIEGVEASVGRLGTTDHHARPIDIDLTYFGEFVQPKLADRPFELVPLAEIAADLIEPVSGKTVRQLAERYPAYALRQKKRALTFEANTQEEAPAVPLGLNRVGVSSLRRIVHLKVGGKERVFNAEFSMVADLRRDRAGLHLSRFSEVLEEAMLEVLARPEAARRVEDIAEAIAREVVGSQRAQGAEVRLRADFGLERWTPVSGKRGEETYTLIGVAHADARGLRRIVGVEAEGMTACPCAQGMVREASMRELRDAGFDEEEARRALDALPVATHNQRGRGTLYLGTANHSDAILAQDLVELVENAMSSETYDLLKRPDEFFIVNKAHRNPKFVEDVVRGMLAGALRMYADFPDDTFVSATQVNYESIHKHDAFAEGFGTFGELRRELNGTGELSLRRTDASAWLRARDPEGSTTG